MCGLTGYMHFDRRPAESSRVILEMLAMQKHRGPDDTGIVGINTGNGRTEVMAPETSQPFSSSPDLVFGFNRLSILDLTLNGHQPMISPDAKVILMMNGEVYNFPEQKEELISKGHIFKSNTDTEVVLHLYLEHGMEGMLNRLNGMFAIAVFDTRLNRLFLARDRFGIKPLYILRQSGFIAFSSEIKSFRALPGFSFDLDTTRLDEFLLFRNVINNTLFRNIVNCTPGTWLSISPEGETQTRAFYNIEDEGSPPIEPGYAFERLEKSLEESVHSQMISDVKLGCQLSGGVDSSLVTYYAAGQLQKGQLETISILFNNPHYSEKTWVDEVAGQLELKSHQYMMDSDTYFGSLDKAVWHFEQPLNHPNTIGIYLLSQEARKHVTVLLSGEGADETLAGYERFVRPGANPYFNRTFLSGLKHNRGLWKDFLSYYSDPDSRMIMATAYGSLVTAHGLKKDFSLDRALSERRDILKKIKGDTLLKQRKYEILTFLPDLLMRQDKMSMAHSIENRVPFLDNKLVTDALALPPHMLVGRLKGKREAKLLLKQICAARFNERFAFRTKMGFGVPLRDLMAGTAFREKWHDQISPGMTRRGVFETGLVRKWYNNPESTTPMQLDAIWMMTGFELWAQQYLD